MNARDLIEAEDPKDFLQHKAPPPSIEKAMPFGQVPYGAWFRLGDWLFKRVDGRQHGEETWWDQAALLMSAPQKNLLGGIMTFDHSSVVYPVSTEPRMAKHRPTAEAEDPKAFFKQTISTTPRTYTPRQLTPREMERLSIILASGPVPFRPIDQRFIDWGWVEFYDDDQHDAVVGKSGFAEFFYGKNGSPRPQFAEPLHWRGRVMTYHWPNEALVESSGGGFIIDAATGRVLRRQLDEGFEGYARIESFDLNEWRGHYQWKGPLPHGFNLLDLAWRTADGMAESADEGYREIFGQLAQPEQQTAPPQKR